MKNKLTTLGMILYTIGMILSVNDSEHLYVNFIGLGIMALAMLILRVIDKKA